MSKYYAGIGSRETPKEILATMTAVATRLESQDYILRSGGAHGADEAFSNGCSNKQIFIPWKGYNNLFLIYPIADEAFVIAKKYHPAWAYLSNGAKALMARNVMQILGPNLDSPSEFVVCWTKDGCFNRKGRSASTGGTGQAISIASDNNIPVYNFKRPEHLAHFNIET